MKARGVPLPSAPEGQLSIAQQALLGSENPVPFSKSRKDDEPNERMFNRPSGTGWNFPFSYPAINCWAIFNCPSGANAFNALSSIPFFQHGLPIG